MERRTKIKLLEHWLEHPEDMGDIPRHMEEIVTTNDIFSLKKEIGWKPFTREKVSDMLSKAKLADLGRGGGFGGFHYGRRGNPKVAIILVIMFVLPTIISVILKTGSNPQLMYPAYAIFGFMIVLVVSMAIIQATRDTRKKLEGRRRDFHASASQ